MRQQDGLNRLHRSLEDTAKLKANDRAIFTEGVDLLQAEKEEDDRARLKFGTDRWTRDPSEKAAEKLYTEMKEFEGYFKSASNSDDLVRNKLKEFEPIFRVLTGTNRDLEAYVPSSKRAAITWQAERESARLRSSLNEVSRLESRRKRKIDTLRDKAKGDSIRKGFPVHSFTLILFQSASNPMFLDSALLRETARLERQYPMQKIEASQFEDLFDKQLRQYDIDRDMVSTEQKSQEQIEEQIREANKAFTAARKGDSSTKEREKALQDLETGYLKYKEIISNIEGGRKFYNDLAGLVGRFRENCKKFVQQRRIEAGQLETYVYLSPVSVHSF